MKPLLIFLAMFALSLAVLMVVFLLFPETRPTFFYLLAFGLGWALARIDPSTTPRP